MEANRRRVSEIQAELSQLLLAWRSAANPEQATNHHRFMTPPTITAGQEDLSLSASNANR